MFAKDINQNWISGYATIVNDSSFTTLGNLNIIPHDILLLYDMLLL